MVLLYMEHLYTCASSYCKQYRHAWAPLFPVCSVILTRQICNIRITQFCHAAIFLTSCTKRRKFEWKTSFSRCERVHWRFWQREFIYITGLYIFSFSESLIAAASSNSNCQPNKYQKHVVLVVNDFQKAIKSMLNNIF